MVLESEAGCVCVAFASRVREETFSLCGHHYQDGEHLTFTCPALQPPRTRYIPLAQTWEDLDTLRMIQVGDTFVDATEEFFLDLGMQLGARGDSRPG